MGKMGMGYRYSSVGLHPSTAAAMPANHIVQLPTGFLVLQVFQLIFAKVVLGLSAFLLSQTSGGVFGAEAFATFTSLVTIIILVYQIVAQRAVNRVYNMWAFLSLDVVAVLFWLSAAGALGALRAAFSVPVNITTCTYGIDPITGDCVDFDKRSLSKRYAWAGDVYLDIVVADAAICGVEAILFLIALVLFSTRLHKHRKQPSRNSFMVCNVNPLQSVNAGERSPEKLEMGAMLAGREGAPQPTHQPSYATLPVYSSAQAYQGAGVSTEGPFSDTHESQYDPPSGLQQPPPTLNYQQPPQHQEYPQSTGFYAQKTEPYQPSVSPAPSYPGSMNSPPPQFDMPSYVGLNQMYAKQGATEMP